MDRDIPRVDIAAGCSIWVDGVRNRRAIAREGRIGVPFLKPLIVRRLAEVHGRLETAR